MNKTDILRDMLRRFVNQSENKLDLVTEAEADGVCAGAVAFGVVEDMIAFLENHPGCKFSDAFAILPDGVAPGADDEEE